MTWEAVERAAAKTSWEAAAHPAAPALELRLFGAAEARVRGEPIAALRTRSGWWALALLALRNGRPVERHWLAGTLWPESSESLAFANLRRSLNDLRHALGDHAYRLHSPSPRLLSLDLAGAAVDVLAFDAAIRLGDQEALKRAVALHRGPLLEGCAEEWVLPEREAREQAYLRAVETLAAAAIDRRSPGEARDYLRLLLIADPLRESAVRSLMEALAQRGDYAALTELYRDFRLLLHQELNAQPDAETAALYHSLRAEAREKAQTHPPALALSAPAMRRLPVPSTPFIGREAEREQLLALLAPLAQSGGAREAGPRGARSVESPDASRHALCASPAAQRLITLTGSGGVGKTRLALAVAEDVAEEYRDGVCFVDLAPVQDPARVVHAAALSLEVREEPNRPLVETLTDHLQARSLLLILDNCEHLAGACAFLAETLLARCPHLQLLATSRQSLGVARERTWRVPSLTLPEGSEKEWEKQQEAPAVLMGSEAIQLFAERATSANPAFRLTRENLVSAAEICRLLDGIPLALEMAAAWVRLMPVAQITPRLRDRLDLLQSRQPGTLARHQTLRAALDWSYDLLDERAQRLLRHLSVFAGGWTLEAAEEVCMGVWAGTHEVAGTHEMGAGSMGVGESGSPMLPYSHTPIPPDAPIHLTLTARGYPTRTPIPCDQVLLSLATLVDASLVDYAEESGAGRYRLLETTRQYAREKLQQSGEESAASAQHTDWCLRLAEEAASETSGIRQCNWYAHLRLEEDNLRAALGWSQQNAIEKALRLAAALRQYWRVRDQLSEGREWLPRLLDSPQPMPPRSRARALHEAGWWADYQGDLEAAQALFAQGGAIARTEGDQKTVASILLALGQLSYNRGDYEQASLLLQESAELHNALGNILESVIARNEMGQVAFLQDDAARAQALYEESLAVARASGDGRSIANTLDKLGDLALAQRDYPSAQAFYAEKLAIYRELDDPVGIVYSFNDLGTLAYRREDYPAAAARYERGLETARRIASGNLEALCLTKLAEVALARKDYRRSRDFCAECLALGRRSGDRVRIASTLHLLARLLFAEGQPQRAAQLFGAAQHLQEKTSASLFQEERPASERLLADLRNCLDAATFASACAKGAAMTLDEAVEYAVTRGAR